MTGSVRREATEAEAKALASPVRLRILRICLGEPSTNKEIAEALGKDPASTLHHVRTLADTGFLAAQQTRRGLRGSREIPYLATGKSWTLHAPGASRIMLEVFLEEVALVPAESLESDRLGLRLTDDLRAELQDRLTDLFEEFKERADEADAGTAWSLFFAIHPDPNRPEPARPAPSTS